MLLLAGRAAHLASLEEDALAAYRAAKALAGNEETRRLAIWGEIGAAIDLELPTAEKLLADAEAECDTLADVINHALQSLMLESRRGAIRSLKRAEALEKSSRRIHDPLLRCSFLSVLGSVLAVAGEYDDVLRVTESLLDEARKHRLDFAVPYALSIRGIGRSGKRNPAGALRDAYDGLAAARIQQDKHATLN